MSERYSYQAKITLDKAHLTECYQQSVAVDHSIMRYKRAIISLVFGLSLLIFELVTDYIGFFVLCLGVLEVFSIHYHQTWWLWRQMLGKSYNSEVTMLIDEKGIHNQSIHVEQSMLWEDVNEIEKTPLGIIIRHSKGVNYLSESSLDDEAIEYVLAKIASDH